MKKLPNYKMIILLLLVLQFVMPMEVNAQRGCCSHHGGVAGCNENGRQICRDGTLSPSCTCTPTITYIYGCTDPEAKNYKEEAEKNDNSCEYYKHGCTDKDAINYDLMADKDDGSCEYEKNENESPNDSNGFLSVLTIGGIDAGIHYLKKKKK